MAKKYKLLPKRSVKFTDLSGAEIEHQMWRIKALRDIPYHNVKAGDLGGWVNHKDALSHEGDSWLGGEAIAYASYWTGCLRIRENALVTGQAIIYGSENSTILVGGSAVVENNAKVFVGLSTITANIRGNARLSDNALIENPVEIMGRIAGDAHVLSFSSVLGGSQVTGNAKVRGSTISDMARVMGNAVVTSGSTISENAILTDYAEVNRAEIRGTATVSGNAKVGRQSVVCDSATVTGTAVVGENTVISGEAIVKDRAIVSEGSRVSGKSIISGTTQTIARKDYANFISEENRTLSDSPSLKELAGTVPSVKADITDISQFSLKLSSLENEINAYGNDIVKLLKFPVMNDLRDENTLEMVLALRNAKSIEPESNPKKFRKAVNSLERKFLKAESNALIISSAAFSDEQHKKAEKARDLFAIACNEVSSEQEKRSAFKQGFRQLVGVVTITDSAVENMRIRVGIPELEA